MINYNNKIFKPVSVSSNGEVSEEVLFHYHQEGDILNCTYKGGQIKYGHLIGKVNKNGEIDIRYHQINSMNELLTGICLSVPKINNDGKILLSETWQWTSGDKSKGTSVLIEI
ncbi:MAG: hypothetical protein P8M34_02445 [Saprospiraceae bacterium]|nr:hypothetical protein [Saprospiraceae bacterium]